MALLTCGDCGGPVSDLASACPRCGRPNATKVPAMDAPGSHSPPRSPGSPLLESADAKGGASFDVSTIAASGLFVLALCCHVFFCEWRVLDVWPRSSSADHQIFKMEGIRLYADLELSPIAGV